MEISRQCAALPALRPRLHPTGFTIAFCVICLKQKKKRYSEEKTKDAYLVERAVYLRDMADATKRALEVSQNTQSNRKYCTGERFYLCTETSSLQGSYDHRDGASLCPPPVKATICRANGSGIAVSFLRNAFYFIF